MKADSPDPDSAAADRIAHFFFALTVITCVAFGGYIVATVL